MVQNAYLLAKIGADTAENGQHLAEILPKTGNYPTGGARAAAARVPPGRPRREGEARGAGRESGRGAEGRGAVRAQKPAVHAFCGQRFGQKLSAKRIKTNGFSRFSRTTDVDNL